jgi:hypothetical protein
MMGGPAPRSPFCEAEPAELAAKRRHDAARQVDAACLQAMHILTTIVYDAGTIEGLQEIGEVANAIADLHRRALSARASYMESMVARIRARKIEVV